MPTALTEKLWRTPNTVCANPPWGFLRDGESHLLYYLARDYYRGAGVIVDGGSFVGRSAWFLATGLAANRALSRAEKLPIHCFDNFIVNDVLTQDALRTWLGVDLPLGASTRPLFDRAVRSVAEFLDVHEGDFHTCQWSPRPIEILFVDIAKSTSLNRRLVEKMFPSLLPGTSVVVQQDYHHPMLPHIHTTMEFLHPYFEIVEPKIDDSAAFLCIREIPASVAIEAASLHERLLPAELVSLMDAAIARLPAEYRPYVELARANLIGTTIGDDEMRDALALIDRQYGERPGDPHWPTYRRLMQDQLEKLARSLSRAWKLVNSGRPIEGLALAGEVGVEDPDYVEALLVRAHALRSLGRMSEAGDILDRARTRQPDNPSVWMETAWLRVTQGEPKGAKEAAQQIRRLSTGHGDMMDPNARRIVDFALALGRRAPRRHSASSDRRAVSSDSMPAPSTFSEELGIAWARPPFQMLDDETRRRVSRYVTTLAHFRLEDQAPKSEPLSPLGEAMVTDRISDLAAVHAALHACDLFESCYGSAAEHSALVHRLDCIRAVLVPPSVEAVLAGLRNASINDVYTFLSLSSDEEFAGTLTQVAGAN